jgi:tape measure domain-containing protein
MADNKIQVLLEVDDKGTASLQKFQRTVAQTGKDGERAFSAMSASSSNLARGVASLAASYASLQGVRALISIADQYTQLEGRLRLVTTSTAELAAVETQLYAVAQQTRVGYAETVELYTRLARATKETGISQTELMSTVQAVNQALIVSGATTTEANAALIQFSQGMASGVLRGEELNSVMEQTPRIAQMIAGGLGISLGQLRAWGKEGKLTSDVVMPALLRSAEDVNREFGLMPTTVSQAGTVLANTLKSLVADANSGSGATKELAEAIIGVSTAVDANRENILEIFAAIVTAAGQAGQAVLNIANSVKGFAAVAAGALSLKEFAGMNAGELTQWMRDYDSGLQQLKDRVKETAAALKELYEEDPDFVDEEALRRATLQFEAAKRELAAFEAKGKDVAATSKDMAAAQAGATTTIKDTTRAVNTAGSAKDTLAKASTTAAKAAEDLAAEQKRLADETEKSGRAMIEDAAKRRELTAELDKALFGTADAYETLGITSRKSYEDQVKAATDAYERILAIEELTDSERARLREGLQSRLIELEDEYRGKAEETIGAIGIAWEDLTEDTKQVLHDWVENAIKMEFDSIGEAFEGLAESILNVWIDLLAKMIAEWAMSGIMGLFTGQGFSGFNASALGTGPGGVGSGWGDSITSLVGGGSSVALSKYGPYASGYATGGGAAAGVTGAQAAGSALGVAGGAYGLYNAAGQVASGNANAGTALQAGISAYSIYKGYPTVAAYLSSLGSTTAAGTAAAYTGAGSLAYGQTGSVVMNAMAAEKMGTAAGSAIVAETTAAGTTAASGASSAGMGAAGAGMTTGMAFTGFGAFVAGLYALQQMGKTPWAEITSPTLGIGVDMPIRGEFSQGDVRRRASNLTDPQYYTGTGGNAGGDAPDSAFGADLNEFDLQPLMDDMRGVLDLLANGFGDGLASLALQLDGTVASTDAMLDAAAGYDVALSSSAEITDLAAAAVGGSERAMDALRAALMSLGLSEQQTETAMLGLISATSTAASAASTAASAVSGMTSNINTLSRTPLNIRVGVETYRIDNSNPYAIEHAVGGIYSSPTLIPSIRGTRHLVGEAGAEAIMPLHDGPGTLKKMHDDIKAIASRPVAVTINLDGRQIASATMPYVDAHVAAKASRNQLANRTVY